jgi:hypothetical protein
MNGFVVGFLAIRLLAGGTPAPQGCGGLFVLTLALNGGGSFNVRMPIDPAADREDGGLVLHGEENERGGWFIGVYRQKYELGKYSLDSENLLDLPRGLPTAGTKKLDIDAMNSPEFEGYKSPLILPIHSTHRSLCMRWVNVRKYGTGAASSFRPGSSVEFRLLRNSE